MHAQLAPWIGQVILRFRKEKRLTQMDIARATGMRSAYISRVETGKTVPSVASVERFAAVLGVPLYQFFLDPAGQMPREGDDKGEGLFPLLQGYVHRMEPSERALVLGLAKRLAARNSD